MSKINVAVIFGGVSNEHDISLKSAVTIINAIPKDKYNVIPVGITKKGRWLYYPGEPEGITGGIWETHPDSTPAVILPDPMYRGMLKFSGGEFSIVKIDAVYPAVHGKNCEDGVLQGLLEMSGIPFVGSGALSSAVCMDKSLTHSVLERFGIKMARWKCIQRSDIARLGEFAHECAEKFGFPVFIKPACSGSSVGISRAETEEEIISGLKTAFSHDSKAIAEEYIKGREIECAVFGNDDTDTFASDPGEIIAANTFYDFDAKYQNAESKTIIPEDIQKDGTAKSVRETAIKAYKACSCRGLSRVDFFLTENGNLYLNEINTLPGFTSISMYPKLMAHMGISITELTDKLIQSAIDFTHN
ncbi:MAG: D-alanine--D-alanine ligase [Ruminococcus sp.]|jgi:D-alanine-D-alanine ligase|nr:D-alanine--D-alanine ligase [Ruminococcus sp.]